jgi:phage shock protein A
MAMQRAVDKTENMRARANAMDELEASGAFDDQLSLTAGQDDIDRQLHELSSSSAVDDDLARMRAELGMGAPAEQQALGSGGGAGTSTETPPPPPAPPAGGAA